MKKILFVTLLMVTLLLGVCGCNKSAKEFKNEYEVLNGQANKNGKIHRTINIDKNNPFEKVSAEEIVKKIENKETFYVYFGDPLCPWCRSVLEKFIEVSNKNKIKKVYYVKVWDDEGNEIVRSKFKLNDKDELEEVVKGTDAYYKLLSYFDEFLSEYTLTDSKGNTVNTNEKRIYAPNFIYVKDGDAKKLVEGISSLQKDSREDLTEEMLTEEENIFNDFFKN